MKKGEGKWELSDGRKWEEMMRDGNIFLGNWKEELVKLGCETDSLSSQKLKGKVMNAGGISLMAAFPKKIDGFPLSSQLGCKVKLCCVGCSSAIVGVVVNPN